MLGVGLWMVGLPIGLTKLYAYAWHKWIGLTVLVLTVLRLAVALAHPPPPLPADRDGWERALAPLAPCGAAGPAARHADQRLADELGGRRQRRLVRLHAAARPGAARPCTLFERPADDAPLVAGR